MADVATIFGWLPAAMDEMSVPELMRWHTRAIKRAKARRGE
ncbi:hypothetical protein QE363_000755 [Sphingomonas sp. SORGH_AS870]|nr:GpE family phage tail protein [Sphingomonas sp. SORGH_AS_0870]MDR6144962.1 hypothetical protein [Sphingomonas sp. SORGH_AS_0870]